MSFVLGITGGIATGKSTVVDLFKKYNFPVIDADIVAREVVEPNRPGLKKIVSTFGEDVLHTDGSLNRQKLGQIVFAEPKKRQALNQLLAPFLQESIVNQIKEARKYSSLVIADIPLLFEAGYEKFVDQIAVVYIPENLQISRLMERENLTEKEAKQKVASQLSIEKKKNRADVIFDNQQDRPFICQQVTSWLKANQFL